MWGGASPISKTWSTHALSQRHASFRNTLIAAAESRAAPQRTLSAACVAPIGGLPGLGAWAHGLRSVAHSQSPLRRPPRRCRPRAPGNHNPMSASECNRAGIKTRPAPSHRGDQPGTLRGWLHPESSWEYHALRQFRRRTHRGNTQPLRAPHGKSAWDIGLDLDSSSTVVS